MVKILAQAALLAPPEVAFAMRSWPLLLPTFAFSLSFYFPSFAFDPLWGISCFFFPGVSSFFSVFCFRPTSGKLPRLKICFPQEYCSCSLMFLTLWYWAGGQNLKLLITAEYFYCIIFLSIIIPSTATCMQTVHVCVLSYY